MQDTSSIGSRLWQVRKERGLTQHRLAEAAGISTKMVSLIERDERTPSVPLVYKLADALGADPSRLLDRHDRLETAGPSKGILAVRNAMLVPEELAGLDVADDGEPLPLGVLGVRVEQAWELYWAGHLGQLAEVLPDLLRSARATERAIGSPACRPLAQTLQIASDLMVHVGHDDAAFGGSMRALRTAMRGDDPLQEATLHCTASWVLLHQGRLAFAENVARAAAEKIQPRGDATMAHLTVYGALLLSAAAPAAGAGNAGAVDTYMDEARMTALRFTGADRHDYHVSFGRSQLAMQRTHQQAVLRNPDAALTAAGLVARSDLRDISFGALQLDRAQAYLDKGNTSGAVDALLAAHKVSPVWAKNQGSWRLSAAAAVRAERHLSDRADKLAKAAGIRP
jgi:transcriptional regulator with XRE-family HTH domain